LPEGEGNVNDEDEKAQEEIQRRPESMPFWTSLSLEELAELQGVEPIDDLDALSALWPVDDDPDEMLEYILAERSARRGREMGT
jgi:hypothetical protein